MKVKLLLFPLAFATQIAMSCPDVGDWNMDSRMGPGMMHDWMNNSQKDKSQRRQWMGCQMSMIRHHYYMQNGLPDKYREASNPIKRTPAAIKSGKLLFEKNCMICHGKEGRGNGDAAKNLSPKPTNIARFAKMGMALDGYLLWTISEGGEKIKTAMPAFKDSLKEMEIWQIVLYLRTI